MRAYRRGEKTASSRHMFTCLFGLFSSCTRSPVRSTDKPLLPGEDVESLGAERVPGCIFCDVSKEKGFDIIWEVRRCRDPNHPMQRLLKWECAHIGRHIHCV